MTIKRDESTTDLNRLSDHMRQALLDALDSLCRCFWGPDTKACRAMRRGDFILPFVTLAGTFPYIPPEIPEQVQAFFDRFKTQDALCQHLEMHYVRLFVSNRDGIAAPLYQSCYVSEKPQLMGPSARAMQARVESRGMALAAGIHEPPDHISIELEYLYFLLERGWREPNPERIDEAVSFATETLLPWIGLFHRKLAVESEKSFYTMAARLTIFVLQSIADPEKSP